MHRIKKKFRYNLFIYLISLIITLMMMPNNLEAFNPQLNFNLVIIAFFNTIIFFKFQYQTKKIRVFAAVL